MSKQVTVRLPDELVDFIDHRVARGEATSRAAVVAAAVERERRRQVADRDAAILAEAGPDDDMTGLAEWVSRQPMDHLD